MKNKLPKDLQEVFDETQSKDLSAAENLVNFYKNTATGYKKNSFGRKYYYFRFQVARIVFESMRDKTDPDLTSVIERLGQYPI